MRKSRAAWIVSIAALAITATALAAAPPSGNQQAIGIARAVQRASAKIPAVTELITGGFAMNDAEGKTSFFAWSFGTGVVPPGWVRATAREALALKNGHVVWARIDLTPECLGAGCPDPPVDIVIDHAGSFWAFARGASSHTCYMKLRGTTPVSAGENVNTVSGHFNAPVHRNDAVLLTSTYPWAGTQTATETDTVSTRPSLTELARIRISAGTSGHPAFTISVTDGYPTNAPPLPQIKGCAGQLVPG